MANILLIDDNPSFLDWLAGALEAEGHDVDTALSGAEALRKLEGNQPELVICDVIMPQLDKSAHKALASAEHDIPVVYISVVDTHGEALLQGAAGFVRKPFVAKTLLEEIRTIVGPGPRAEILLVDDDPSVLEVLSSILAAAGFRLRQANNGRQALEVLAQAPSIGLVITDVNMPIMTGVELVKALRADARWTDLPIMVQTSDPLMTRPSVWSDLHVERTMDKTHFVSWLLQVINDRVEAHPPRQAAAMHEHRHAAD